MKYELTSWFNGTASWGLRLKPKDREELFSREKHKDCQVVVFLPRKEKDTLRLNSKLTPSFWNTCSEFRFTGAEKEKFKEWLKTDSGGSGWPFGTRRGKPYKYDATITINSKEICVVLRGFQKN